MRPPGAQRTVSKRRFVRKTGVPTTQDNLAADVVFTVGEAHTLGVGTQLPLDPHAHEVSFYVEDQDIVDQLALFVVEGGHEGGRAVVLATSQHCNALVETLRAMCLDPDRPPVAGRLVLLDADETLRSFTTESGLDRDRFRANVGQPVI